MTIDLSELNDLVWYGYVIAGFCLGTYIHSHRIRHWLHLLAIKVLRGFIWMLHKTDYYYREPRVPKSKPDFVSSISNKKGDIEVGDDELKRWLAKNPELSVAKR